MRDSSTDRIKVGILKLSADSRIDCSILELTVGEVRMVFIVGILHIIIVLNIPQK